MTIRRQYNLPNCTLILDGLSDTLTGSPSDARPLMSMLVNVECRLAGRDKPLTGGREFLESLVTATSRYAQEFLSGVPHPGEENGRTPLVRLQKIGGNLHRLTVQSGARIGESGASLSPVQMDLTTVQLFDLVEAVDQFFADTRTLPDMSLQLTPVSKRYARTYEPLAKRAVPAALGLSSLAAAAIAFSLMPVPQVQRAGEPASQSKTESISTTPTPSPESKNASSGSELDAMQASVPEITDPIQLEDLKSKLYSQIDAAWKREPPLSEEIIYRVGVSGDGAVVGYKPVNEAAINAKETPLKDLISISPEGGAVKASSLAQFQVVLTAGGVVQVSPWQGGTAGASASQEITDPALLADLQEKLRNEIDKTWRTHPTFDRDLTFSVSITKDGVIADFTPLNQPASDYVGETPLPSLRQPPAPDTQEPLAKYRVVFTPGGVLQVSPWTGYQ
jgi:hypothetical protein